MKSYNFSMEKVLGWRETIEKTTMEEFATIQNELVSEKSKLSGLMKTYCSTKEKGMNCKTIYELRQQHLYKQTLEEKIELQNEVIIKTKDELEVSRLELVDAQRDRKVMEKLREKDFIVYQENVRSVEQKELDEMAILQFSRMT